VRDEPHHEAPLLTLGEYWHHTREIPFNVVAVVFLLGVYEAGTLASGQSARNAADHAIKEVLGHAGAYAIPAFHLLLMALVLIGLVTYWRQSVSPLRYVVPFILECTVYAGLLSPLVFWLQAPFLAAPAGGDLILDLGAGVYEEIVFRLILTGGPLLLLRADPWRVFVVEGAERASATATVVPVAVVTLVSAFCFAAYHHIGGGADPYSGSLFGFRFLAGLLLAALFFWRGLAVAVYTHAIYDVIIHLGQS
jgi:Type II CAAX prenyl endopeptidase Rce1-like